ncbi:hypothetical protein BLOT_015596 [Blomia tropicalis]|nr:hypothetical protein BLOT_015596 [Blomia tropicalis]
MKNSSKINFFNIDILLLVTTICIQRSIMIVIIQQFNNRSYIEFKNPCSYGVPYWNQKPSDYVPTQLINAHDPSWPPLTQMEHLRRIKSFNMWPIQIRSNSIKRMINGFDGKFEDLIGIYNPILEHILMMVFTIRKIFDWYLIRSQQHAKRQKILSISPKCFATFTTSHRECLYPSTSTTTFNSFILVLNNIIHSSISTATPINIATNIFVSICYFLLILLGVQ